MKIPDQDMRSKSPVGLDFSRRASTESCEAYISLSEAIKNKKLKIGFRKFLESEFSVENLDFWLAVEEYKKIESAKLRRLKATEIFDEFVSSSSPNQVNIDYRTQQKIAKDVTGDTSQNIDLFDTAQKSIFNIMENDSFVRFLRSKYYEISNQSGRRSPKKFLQDMIHNSARRRSLSPSISKIKQLPNAGFNANLRSTPNTER